MVTDRENISEKRVKYQRFVDVVLSSAPVWNLPWMGDDLGRAIATKTDGKCGGRPVASAQGSHAGSRHLHLCLRPDIVSAPHEHVP